MSAHGTHPALGRWYTRHPGRVGLAALRILPRGEALPTNPVSVVPEASAPGAQLGVQFGLRLPTWEGRRCYRSRTGCGWTFVLCSVQC